MQYLGFIKASGWVDGRLVGLPMAVSPLLLFARRDVAWPNRIMPPQTWVAGGPVLCVLCDMRFRKCQRCVPPSFNFESTAAGPPLFPCRWESLMELVQKWNGTVDLDGDGGFTWLEAGSLSRRPAGTPKHVT